ncbi:hypothetical protein K8I85_08750 [bacterium]|nr:hypothetical protein [bacterium]
MRRSLKLVVPGLVCLLSLVVLSVSSVAADGPNTDPIDPPGATEPTSTFTDVVVDVIQTAWGTIWAVIL